MEISTKSWHYKLNSTFRGPFQKPSDSLCPYVRELIYRIIAIAALFGLVSFMSVVTGASVLESHPMFGLGSPTVSDVFSGSLPITHYIAISGIGMLGVVAFLAALVASFLVVYFTSIGLGRAWDTSVGFIKSTKPKVRPKSVFVQYLIAKHNKICPRITFKK